MDRVVEGNCLEVMRGMEENSVDAVVTDPPYGLGFMGKSWDKFKLEKKAKSSLLPAGGEAAVKWEPNSFQEWCKTWAAECLRVAKPGAFLLAFGGTRTFHRLARAIEDAEWILRDTLSWNYGSGFPKSKNIALAIDKGEGHPNRGRAVPTASHFQNASTKHLTGNPVPDYEAKSEAAKEWEGYGTALKPAWEPIILAQAPLEGTYAENVLKWGCGALNIDACRIATDRNREREYDKEAASGHTGSGKPASNVPFVGAERKDGWLKQGRWPANFLLSHSVFCEKVGEREVKSNSQNTAGREMESGIFGKRRDGEHYGENGLETVEDWNCVESCPVRMLDEQSGVQKDGVAVKHRGVSSEGVTGWGKRPPGTPDIGYGGRGGASRFFYCSKASRSERNAGLEELNALFEKRVGREKVERVRQGLAGEKKNTFSQNAHPTVKPIALMRYLCRLITPPSGLILDPFAGSGSTGCAATLEGFDFTGIEKEKEYVEIARARISHFSQGRA